MKNKIFSAILWLLVAFSIFPIDASAIAPPPPSKVLKSYDMMDFLVFFAAVLFIMFVIAFRTLVKKSKVETIDIELNKQINKTNLELYFVLVLMSLMKVFVFFYELESPLWVAYIILIILSIVAFVLKKFALAHISILITSIIALIDSVFPSSEIAYVLNTTNEYLLMIAPILVIDLFTVEFVRLCRKKSVIYNDIEDMPIEEKSFSKWFNIVSILFYLLWLCMAAFQIFNSFVLFYKLNTCNFIIVGELLIIWLSLYFGRCKDYMASFLSLGIVAHLTLFATLI